MPIAEFIAPYELMEGCPMLSKEELFPTMMPHEVRAELSDCGKHLARYIKAEKG
eukprot:CAMPEP_0183598462 /NCGR_PEP_ID=MMETSP0371-20130417/178768_1 /TAXON_ID=268820 /ORGANISM="Peridinium aciculiferum, Strain PAER-2" /LENGTH=53 /DNA_ID=CAMNT_0025810507 /DNA_START=246 /DNA_END=403 /DNA_ORIENTATION=-